MPAEIVNLNKARKAKARDDDKKRAEENRVRCGRNNGEKQKEKFESETRAKLLDDAKLHSKSKNETDDAT